MEPIEHEDLFNGHYFAHHAANLFLQARTVKADAVMREHYRAQAIKYLHSLADSQGLVLVKRSEIQEAA